MTSNRCFFTEFPNKPKGDLFSQERMTYIAADASADGVAKVIYDSKNGKVRSAKHLTPSYQVPGRLWTG
jgi:hypothetical protein